MRPIFAARYDTANTGLHRRSLRADYVPIPSVTALLITAADIADMPICACFCQDDVPSELSPPVATLLMAISVDPTSTTSRSRSTYSTFRMTMAVPPSTPS